MDTGTTRISVIIGDITKQKTDAIINAANNRGLGGGGVDGAIHRAAGPQLLAECRKLPTDGNGTKIPTGDARITGGGNLPCKHVIHTAGPNCSEVQDESEQDQLLASCYRRSLEIAAENGCRTVASPSISTGVFGFPLKRAAAVAARTVTDFLAEHPKMSFTMCAFCEADRVAYAEAFGTARCPAAGTQGATVTSASNLSREDMRFLEKAAVSLAFVMQRINRQLDTGNPPGAGTQALAGFRAIDFSRLQRLAEADATGSAKALVDIYREVAASEKEGWLVRVCPRFWNGSLYDKSDARPATSFDKWAHFGQQKSAPFDNTQFPTVLTASDLASFTQTDNGSTRPHHGWINGTHFIAKCARYAERFGISSDGHVHNECLADEFLRAAGLTVPDSKEYKVDFADGKGLRIVRLSLFVENTRPLGEVVERHGSHIPGWLIDRVLTSYPAQAFIGGIDTFQNDNVLVDDKGELWFVDNGAAFDYRARGGRKTPSWFDRTDPADSSYGYMSLMRHPSQGLLRKVLSEELVLDIGRKCDFESLAAKLPKELSSRSVMRFAKSLDAMLSRN